MRNGKEWRAKTKNQTFKSENWFSHEPLQVLLNLGSLCKFKGSKFIHHSNLYQSQIQDKNSFNSAINEALNLSFLNHITQKFSFQPSTKTLSLESCKQNSSNRFVCEKKHGLCFLKNFLELGFIHSKDTSNALLFLLSEARTGNMYGNGYSHTESYEEMQKPPSV